MGMPGCVEDSLETCRMLRNELAAFAQKELRIQLADLRAKLREDFHAELLDLQVHAISAPVAPQPEQPREESLGTLVALNSKRKIPKKIPPVRLLDARWYSPDSEEISLEGRLAFLHETREAAGKGPLPLKANGRPASIEAGAASPMAGNNELSSPGWTDDHLAPYGQLRLTASDENPNGGKQVQIREPEPTYPEPPAEPLQTLEVLNMETRQDCSMETLRVNGRYSESSSYALDQEAHHQGASAVGDAAFIQPPERSPSKYSDADSNLQASISKRANDLQVPKAKGSCLANRVSVSNGTNNIPLASAAPYLRQAYIENKSKTRLNSDDTNLFFTHVKSKFNRRSQAALMSAEGGLQPAPAANIGCWRRFTNCLGRYADYPVACAIFLNGVFLGVQTQYQSSKMTQAVPPVYPVFEVVFCVVFTAELIVKLGRNGYKYFIGPGWKWNIFDFLLVMMQLVEVAGMFTTQHESKSAPPTANVSYLRLLRILRLFRVLRLVRLLQFIGELNTIISSITNSMRPLFWTMILLLLMVYVVGIVFTQMVFNHRMEKIMADDLESNENDRALEYWFGTLWRTILSLYEAILGGTDWDALVSPLVAEISVLAAPVFMFYVAFVLLAMMNVITGIFVESALKNAHKEQEMDFYSSSKELFCKGYQKPASVVTRDHFQEELAQSHFITLLRQVGIEKADAELMFTLLDVDNLGEIDLDDLLAGLLRLRSSAKVFDIALFMHE